MRRLLQYRFRRTTLWLLLFLSVLIGLALTRTGLRLGPWYCLVLVLPVVLTLRRRQTVTVILVILFGIVAGSWRGGVYDGELAGYQIPQGQVTIAARALNDALYDTHKQLAFDASQIVVEDTGQSLPGKMQLSGFGLNAVFAGDQIEASGKLYKGYGSYAGTMSFAKLDLVAHHPSLISVIRAKFTAGMQTALPEPIAPFAMGLLIGQRATLPASAKQDLLMVGLTHIIAVSGYNLTIILHACQRILGKRSKRISTFLTLGLIAVFLLLAGASASIVRAAIVSVLSIGATYYGRSFKPLNLIALAAALTAWINPVYEWSDLSWYLSFLAFYGVMVVSPLFQARLPEKWHESVIGGVALESICAEIMSLPFILYIFGQMSLVGLPANVLITTLVPLAMLLGVVAGLAGMFASSIAGWFAWPAKLLLQYMLDTAHILASLPHIFIENRTLPLAGMIGLYLLILAMSWLLHNKTKAAKSATITDTDVRT